MKKRFIILILFSLFICMFGVSAGTFTWYGHIRWQNDSTVINATNITLTILEAGGGTSYSNLSNASGYFVIAGLDDTKDYSSSIIKYANHITQAGNATGIGPTLPPPAFIYQNELLNATIYLKQAANIYLTANNGSDGISFEYMVKDTKIGFPIAEKMGSAVYNASIPVQKDRNYSITLMPDGHSPPISVFTNVSNYPSPYFVRKDINCSTTMIRVSGYLRNSSGNVVNGTLTNFTLKRHILESGNMLIEEFSIPADMGSWEGGANDILNASSAFYNITIPSVAAGFKVALVAYVNDSNGVWYAAFQNITLSGANNREQNLTIRKLAGNYATGTYSNTSKVVISATNGSSAVSNAHVEVKLKYKDNDDNDFEFTWMTTTNTSGKIAIPLWQDYAIEKLAIYSSNYAPYKKKVKSSLINSSTTSITTTLKSFDPSSINGEVFDKDLISIQFIISNSTCDVPEIFSSTHSCVAASDDNGELNPLKAMLRGKISFRMIKPDAGIYVHYKNVDMMASGPPDAIFDDTAVDSSSGADFEALWKFGSSGPDVYDEVLIGANYSTLGLDDSAPVKILLPLLYDDDWGIAWNVTANGTNGLAGNLTDYADFNMTWFNASTGGMTCYESSTANCYINKTLKMIWLRIPHFSGLGPTVDGYTLGNVSANTTAESFTCYGNCTVYINVTNNNYTLSGLQNITINNTDSTGNILNWTIYEWDGNSFVYNFTNSTTHLNYTFTLYNASNPMNSTHQYKIDIYRSANVTTQWNFTYNVSGMSDVLKLTMDINCVASCKTWGEWGTCTGTGEIGTRTRTCSVYKYNCGDALSATENCFTSGSGTGSSGGGGSASYALSVNTETGPRTMTVKTSDSVNLYVNGDSHSFKVTKIYDDYITIMIKSEPKYYDIKVNETKKIDIDTDGDIDLIVTLHEIVSNLRVRLTIEKFVSDGEEAIEEVEEIETEEFVEEEAREVISKRFIKKVKTMSPWVWLIILAIAVLIILFVLSYRRKGKPGKGRVKRKKHQLIFNSFFILSKIIR